MNNCLLSSYPLCVALKQKHLVVEACAATEKNCRIFQHCGARCQQEILVHILLDFIKISKHLSLHPANKIKAFKNN